MRRLELSISYCYEFCEDNVEDSFTDLTSESKGLTQVIYILFYLWALTSKKKKLVSKKLCLGLLKTD